MSRVRWRNEGTFLNCGWIQNECLKGCVMSRKMLRLIPLPTIQYRFNELIFCPFSSNNNGKLVTLANSRQEGPNVHIIHIFFVPSSSFWCVSPHWKVWGAVWDKKNNNSHTLVHFPQKIFITTRSHEKRINYFDKICSIGCITFLRFWSIFAKKWRYAP